MIASFEELDRTTIGFLDDLAHKRTQECGRECYSVDTRHVAESRGESVAREDAREEAKYGPEIISRCHALGYIERIWVWRANTRYVRGQRLDAKDLVPAWNISKRGRAYLAWLRRQSDYASPYVWYDDLEGVPLAC